MKYEYKKLFSSKLMIFMLLLTLGYMAFLPIREVWEDASKIKKKAVTYESVISQAKSDNKTCGDLYNDINSIFTSVEEENGSLEAIYSDDPFLDLSSITLAADMQQYVTTGFEADRKELIKGMIYQNVSENQKSDPDNYLIKANEKAIKQYNSRIDLKFESTGVNNSTHYSIFNYSIWEFVMIAFCVMMTVRLFTLEYTGGAYQLVNTSRRTLKSLFIKKYFTVLVIMILILLIQAVFEIILGMYVFGLKNFSLPIQQIEQFEYCPYTITIAEFYIFKFFIRVLSYTAVISLSSLAAVVIKRPLISTIIIIVISAGGLFANMTLYVMIDKVEKSKARLIPAYDRLRLFLPQSLLNIKEYFNGFDCFSLFGFPVSRIAFCINFTAVLSIICITIGYKASGKIRRAA